MARTASITSDMVVQAGFDVVREGGLDALTIRAVAARLGCSTQPVLSSFPTSEQLKMAVYEFADQFHSAYLAQPDQATSDPLLSTGMRYVRFAAEERNLFRLLFQSDGLGRGSVHDLMDNEALAGIVSLVADGAGVDERIAHGAFECLTLVAHGYASFLANNALVFDEAHCAQVLTAAFEGAVGAFGRETR